MNSTIHFPKFGNKDLFSNLFVFLGVLSILPVMENMLSLSSMDASDYADAYYSKGEEDFDTRKHFSFLGRIPILAEYAMCFLAFKSFSAK